MTRKQKVVLALVALAVAAAIGGCGGGDGDDQLVVPPPDSELPFSALSSSEGLIAYLRELIAERTDEDSEPVMLGDVTLPTSETLDAFPVR